MPKVTKEEINSFLTEYYSVSPQHLRLGQAFVNKYLPNTIDADLFYEEDNLKAVEVIAHKYCED